MGMEENVLKTTSNFSRPAINKECDLGRHTLEKEYTQTKRGESVLDFYLGGSIITTGETLESLLIQELIEARSSRTQYTESFTKELGEHLHIMLLCMQKCDLNKEEEQYSIITNLCNIFSKGRDIPCSNERFLSFLEVPLDSTQETKIEVTKMDLSNSDTVVKEFQNCLNTIHKHVKLHLNSIPNMRLISTSAILPLLDMIETDVIDKKNIPSYTMFDIIKWLFSNADVICEDGHTDKGSISMSMSAKEMLEIKKEHDWEDSLEPILEEIYGKPESEFIRFTKDIRNYSVKNYNFDKFPDCERYKHQVESMLKNLINAVNYYEEEMLKRE